MLKQKILAFIIILNFFIFGLPLSSYAANNCVYCGEGTEYRSCFNVEFIKKKFISVMKGCIDIKRDKKLESETEITSIRQKNLELKLMKEFCSDPVNNMGTACTKFHYSRIGKYD